MNTTTKPFRPLLAAQITDDIQLEALDYPVIVSPKVDGIRCLIHPELGPVTRSLKPIRNLHIKQNLNHSEHHWMDGELVLGYQPNEHPFNKTSSAVMSHNGEPIFTFHVFDDLSYPEAPYKMRHEQLRQRHLTVSNFNVSLLHAEFAYSCSDVINFEQKCLSRGFEGIMIRHRNGPYKFGRSTLKEQTLIKLKRFQDSEAQVIGLEELQHNQNNPTINSQGLQERSSHKANQLAGDTLGALIVKHPLFGIFSIGSGFDAATRDEIWQNQNRYLHKTVKFKYQPLGTLTSPRFPVFIGFRAAEDQSGQPIFDPNLTP
jgi:DNA ligase-1